MAVHYRFFFFIYSVTDCGTSNIQLVKTCVIEINRIYDKYTNLVIVFLKHIQFISNIKVLFMFD